jgi:acyl carrier protein
MELKHIDPLDIEDLLVKIEDSFNVKIAESELSSIKTFGEFCDYIKLKIPLEHIENCTTQQAYYKLRENITKFLKIDRNNITPATLLVDFLPRKERKLRIKRLEQELGHNLSILRPPYWVTDFLLLLFGVSCITLFFSTFGLIGLVLTIIGLGIADKIGNELDLKTVGELTKKITREHYLNSRRNSNTFNKNEIEKVLTEWFITEFDLDKSKLTRTAKFE